jgi:hypothetical protein
MAHRAIISAVVPVVKADLVARVAPAVKVGREEDVVVCKDREMLPSREKSLPR